MSEAAVSGAVGMFTDLEAALRAVRGLREEGFTDVTTYSPVANQEMLEAMESRPSPVRLWTLVGGLVGCASGLALTIYTVLDRPLRTGAKPIVSIPPFLIIAFELTILLGALGALLGFLVSAGLPHRSSKAAYEPRFSVDRFGVFVRCNQGVERAQEILRRAGAEEVRVEQS